MNILLCRSLFNGPCDGAGETLVAYATQLAKEGHNPSVTLMYEDQTQSQYTTRLIESGIEVSYVGSRGVYRAMMMARRLMKLVVGALPVLPDKSLHAASEHISNKDARRYSERCRTFIERSEADIVHVLSADVAAPIMIEAARDARVPILFHDLGEPGNLPQFEPYHRRLIRALPACTMVAALSPQLAVRCRSEYPEPHKVAVLPLIVEDVGRKATQLTQPSTVTFGFAGRLEPLKGALLLTESFASLFDELPLVALQIAGTGSAQSAMLKNLRRTLATDSCQFIGPYTTLEGKRAFMHGLDILVHPSFSEGTPNTVIEAMSAGLPVIASAVGGIPDLVSPESGILVPPGNAAALTDAMRLLATDPELRLRMGAAGRRRYEMLFSPAKVLPLLVDTYRRVSLAKHQAPPSSFEPSGETHLWATAPLRAPQS